MREVQLQLLEILQAAQRRKRRQVPEPRTVLELQGHPSDLLRVAERPERRPMMFRTFVLTFGEFLANFERLVLGCIETNLCK